MQRDQNLSNGTVIILPHEQYFHLNYYLDSFLEMSRRCQNALIPFIRTSLSISLPNSFHDLVKGIKKLKYSLRDDISSIAENYWEKHGAKLRAYRDLSQHHSIISPNAYLLKKNSDLLVHFVLPSNPEVKSMKKLNFNYPKIHAYQYIRGELYALIELFFEITYPLLNREEPGKRRIHKMYCRPRILFNSSGPLMSGVEIPNLEKEKTEIQKFIEDVICRLKNEIKNNSS